MVLKCSFIDDTEGTRNVDVSSPSAEYVCPILNDTTKMATKKVILEVPQDSSIDLIMDLNDRT